MDNPIPPEHRSAPLGLEPVTPYPGLARLGLWPFIIGVLMLTAGLGMIASHQPDPVPDPPTIHEDPRVMDLCRAYLQWEVEFGDLDLTHLEEFCPT